MLSLERLAHFPLPRWVRSAFFFVTCSTFAVVRYDRMGPRIGALMLLVWAHMGSLAILHDPI